MEGLFSERLQVRTRHSEERVSALTTQLAAQKHDNALLLKSRSDATHKVQSLEGELKSERERFHKLSATLSSCRRNMKKKILRSEAGDHDYYDSDPASSQLPGNATINYQCRQCGGTAPVHHEILKNYQNYQLLPNYMGIMPARLNHKPMKSKKTGESSLNHHQIAYHGGQVGRRRPALSIDPSDHFQFYSCDQTSDYDVISCAGCCRNVDVFLARRLHLNDHVQQECSTGSGLASQSLARKRQNENRRTPSLPITQLHQRDHRLLHNDIACEHNCCPSVPKQRPVDRSGIINTSTLLKNPGKKKTAAQDLQSLTTLSAEGFYVRMETAKVDCQQQHESPPATSCGSDRLVNHGDEHIVGGDYHDLWGLQYVQALKAENKALRGALLSSKKIEIHELESELQDIKQCASGAATSSGRKVNLSSDKSATIFDNHTHTSNNTDLKVIYDGSQVDPIKFLDSLHVVEDKILQEKTAILGLECGDAHTGDAARVDCADYLRSTDGVHSKALLTEDLQHLLKALASKLVLLKQENQWLKQKCHDATQLG